MEKKVLYILIAVVAVIVVAGVAIAAVSGNNNSGGGSGETTTVTYHGNGGTHADKDTYQTTSDTVPLLTWTRNGYEAVGYTVSTDSTGTVYKYGDKVPSGVRDLYVKWEKVNLTVTIINLPSGLKVTCDGKTLASGDSVECVDGKCTITVENVTPGTYKFESNKGLPSNTLYVDESGVHKYTLAYTGSTYSPSSHESYTRNEDNTEVYYILTNYRTLTLTFESVSPM